MKKFGLSLAAIIAAATTSAAVGQIVINNSTPGAFIDIAVPANNLNIEGDDVSGTFLATHGNIILPAGNIFPSSNGTLTSPAQNGFTNAAITGTSNNGYYPFWDDMRTDLNADGIYGVNLVDRTIIQWNNMQLFGAPGTDFGTFQIQIFSSGPILAQMIYRDVTWTDLTGHDGGLSATIGAKVDATNFAQWSFNMQSIQDGTILTIVPAPASLALLGLGGLIAGRRRRA
jgi:hypothetical protein